jgi:hypothetical protein
MEVEKTLRPGADGTAKYVNRFGDQLVCVRHRLDRQANKRYTTVELILEERERTSHHLRPYRAGPDDVCQLRVQAHERAMIELVRRANGRWEPETRTWLVASMEVERHCLWDRVVKVQAPTYGRKTQR